VSIRPEKIQLIEEPVTKQNSLEGIVFRSTYIGSDTHVYLDVRGQTIKVWDQNRISTVDPNAFYRKGEKVWLSLIPENTVILPKD